MRGGGLTARREQSQRLEPGPTKRHTPIKRRLDVLPADEQPTDGVVQQLPTWMQHKRSLPPPAASEEEPLAAALLHAHDHSGAAPPHGAVAGRAGQMVAMARRTRPMLAGAAPRAGTGATVFTTAGGASATAMEEAQTFLEQERLRGFPETPPDSEDTDGRDANGSAVGAALAFLDESDKFRQSARRQKAAQVAKAKARTKALMEQRKPPRVATPHIGTSRAHLAPGRRRVRQSDTRYAFEKEAVNSPISAPVSPAGNAGAKERNTADLGVLSPELTPGRIQLPMRYIRLCQQFEFLDTALAFAKTRRQTEIVTYEVAFLFVSLHLYTCPRKTSRTARKPLSLNPGAFGTSLRPACSSPQRGYSQMQGCPCALASGFVRRRVQWQC